MSRTSRRISRPLLAVLGVVIVFGILFTIHKVKSSRAAEIAKSTPPPAPAVIPAPAPAISSPTAPPAPATTAPASPAPVVALAPAAAKNELDSALVTETPTAAPPTTQPGTHALDPSAQARADLPDLSNHTANTSTPPQNSDTPVAQAESSPPARSAPGPDVSNSSQPLDDAKSKSTAGDLIGSRQLLNDALLSGKLNESDADAAKKEIEEINKTLVFSPRRFPNDPWGGVYQVASGERLATIAGRNSVTWNLLSRINGVTPKRLRSGQNIKIFKGPFHAVVYKHLFKLEIYLGAPSGPGSMYITSYPVGLGKDNSTPVGLWICKAGDKIKNPRYYPPRGGDVIAPDDPKNPLGGYWIALEGQSGEALGKESYGLHGTIDPDSIGKMESMGCIRLRSQDIAWVFDLLVDGKSQVLVKE